MVQCKQVLCEECYKEDLCCLVRPWGEKIERHLKDFYQNKLVDGEGMSSFNHNLKYGNEYRMDAVKRTIEYYIGNFDNGCHGAGFRGSFKVMTRYMPTFKHVT